MDTEKYKAECYRQLNDPKFYKRLPKDITRQVEDRIHIRLKRLLIDDEIEEYTSPALKMHEICLNFRKTSEWKFRIVIQKTSIAFRDLNMPKLKFFPHCTEYPPQYWCYPPLYWCYPPTSTDVIPLMYWIPSTVLKLSPHCTDVIPPLYWTTSTALKVSPHSTEAIPHMYCCYPPTVLKLSPTCTAVIPPQYWRYPSTVLNTLHSTDVIPPHVLMLSPTVLNHLHSTEANPPQYWSYPPTVLNNLHSTEAIPHSTEAIPPQYWCYPPDVLNNLQCTEQPAQYWTDVIWGDISPSCFTKTCTQPTQANKQSWRKEFGIFSWRVHLHAW